MVDRTYSKVGPYTILKTLGCGGYGTVKKAIHETSNKLVAIKLLNSELNKEAIINEMVILKKLRHPNLANIIDYQDDLSYFKKDGRVLTKSAIVMELAERGNLFDHLKITSVQFSRGFRENTARTFFKQLIAGIEYCHGQGIAHRDLKPDNVLLDADYNLKLCDFGWATSVTRTLKTKVGTKTYQAPEILDEKIYEGPPIDVFSAGVVLFLLLSGHPPFKSATVSDPWYGYIGKGNYDKFWDIHEKKKPKEKKEKDQKDLLPFYSTEFRDIINKMLDYDPKKRLTIAQIKDHAWYQGTVVTNEDLAREFTNYTSLIDKVLQKEKLERREEKRTHAELVASGKVFQGVFNGYVPYRGGATEQGLDDILTELKLSIDFSIKRQLIQISEDNSTLSPNVIYSTEPANVVFKRLVIIGKKVFGLSMKINDNKYKIKGRIVADEDAKELEITIYLSVHDEESIAINFIKTEGDRIKFIDDIEEKFHKPLNIQLFE